jgi:hypothetical protein
VPHRAPARLAGDPRNSSGRSDVTCSMRVSPVAKGALLAIANTVLVAAAFPAWDGKSDPALAVSVWVLQFGLPPAILTGIVLGWLASVIHARPWVRIALLLPSAIAVVVMLGAAFGLEGMILLSSIPTAVGVLILERWTRAPDSLPAARALRPQAIRQDG